MTERQILLVKKSWSYIIANGEEAGETFYQRLFEVAPQLRPMFKTAIPEQSRKLISMVTLIVSKLHKLEIVIEEIKYLAKRHTSYGAKPLHYKIVGECLLWTLEKGLGEKWNDESAMAWKEAYTILSEAMIISQSEAPVKSVR